MNIDELKFKFNIDTSEALFGIREQPKDGCPIVDSALSDVNTAIKEIGGYCKDLRNIDDIDQAISISKDIEWVAGCLDIQKQLEQLREKCESLRSWGQEWKELAKSAIEHTKTTERFIKDDFYNELLKESNYKP